MVLVRHEELVEGRENHIVVEEDSDSDQGLNWDRGKELGNLDLGECCSLADLGMDCAVAVVEAAGHNMSCFVVVVDRSLAEVVDMGRASRELFKRYRSVYCQSLQNHQDGTAR